MLVTGAAVTAILLVASLPAATAAEPGVPISSKQLTDLVFAVRAETNASKQGLAAQDIARLLNGADLRSIDIKALEDLASLLDASNDEVRRWVAVALGLFESRAGFAVPKLMEVLGKVDCPYMREHNSAGAVRNAVHRITGENPPPVVCLIKVPKQEGV